MDISQENTSDILRIYICGPHSTGKTTLLKDLKPHLKDITIGKELTRDILKAHGWSRDDYAHDKHRDRFKQLSEELLTARISTDNKYTFSGNDYISVRGLDPIVYVAFYLDEEEKRSMYTIPGVKEWIKRLKKSLVILVYPHLECIQYDHVRPTSTLNELQRFHDAFERELQQNEIPYMKLTVLDRQKRVTEVLAEINRYRETMQH